MKDAPPASYVTSFAKVTVYEPFPAPVPRVSPSVVMPSRCAVAVSTTDPLAPLSRRNHAGAAPLIPTFTHTWLFSNSIGIVSGSASARAARRRMPPLSAQGALCA